MGNGIASMAGGNGTFFVSAVVSFYCVFLCFAALQADDDDTCNVFAGQKDTASLWIGYLWMFGAVFYAAYKADQMGLLVEPEPVEAERSGFDMETPLLIEQEEEKRAAAEREAEERKEAEKNRDPSMLSNKESNYDDVDEEKQGRPGPPEENLRPEGQRLSNIYFHSVMLMASCYVAMLMTSWGTGATISTTGATSMYVNIVCQYITALMYWWSLCAPSIFPERFGNGDDEE